MAGYAGKFVKRNESEEYKNHPTKYTIGRLVSPDDEGLDIENEKVAGKASRGKRPKQRGLLLLYPIDYTGRADGNPIIGFAFSFPESSTAETVDYVVNKLYWEQELGLA